VLVDFESIPFFRKHKRLKIVVLQILIFLVAIEIVEVVLGDGSLESCLFVAT